MGTEGHSQLQSCQWRGPSHRSRNRCRSGPASCPSSSSSPRHPGKRNTHEPKSFSEPLDANISSEAVWIKRQTTQSTPLRRCQTAALTSLICGCTMSNGKPQLFKIILMRNCLSKFKVNLFGYFFIYKRKLWTGILVIEANRTWVWKKKCLKNEQKDKTIPSCQKWNRI